MKAFMKRVLYGLFLIGIFVICGCQKGQYPYITANDVRKIDSVVHPAITNVAFIYKNNVYYAADLDKPVTQITKDGAAVKFVKMSHDHTKFAYQNAAGKIVVIDNKGTVLTTLTQYSKVKSFDWSADDKTLYILNDATMVYYGPGMNLPAIVTPGIVAGSTIEVLSASVSMQGDFAYVVHGYSFLYGDKYILYIQAKNGKLITYSDPTDSYYVMNYVSFSINEQDLAVGYQVLNSGTTTQQTVRLFTALKAYPDFSYGGTTYGGVSTPVYNSKLIYMVAGAAVNTGGNFAPSALYLAPTPTTTYVGANVATDKILDQYTVSGGVIYTDWK